MDVGFQAFAAAPLPLSSTPAARKEPGFDAELLLFKEHSSLQSPEDRGFQRKPALLRRATPDANFDAFLLSTQGNRSAA